MYSTKETTSSSLSRPYIGSCHRRTYVSPKSILSSENSNQQNYLTHTMSSYDQRISDQGNKYIIQLKTDDYQDTNFTITPSLTNNQLIIDAKHREEDHLGGYIHRELHKIFLIPKHIDLNQHTHSYNKKTQELTIEMPYKNPSVTFAYQNHHTINRNEKNKLSLSFDLKDYQPEDIKISIQDQELIVKAEKQSQNDAKKSRSTFFQSTRLPSQIDIECLQSNFLNGKLTIDVPYLDHKTSNNHQQGKSLDHDSHQQRIETTIEFIRLRRF